MTLVRGRCTPLRLFDESKHLARPACYHRNVETVFQRYDKSVFSRAEIFFLFFFFIIPIINSYLRCVPLIYFRRIFISESNTGNQRFHRGRNVYEIFNVYVTSLKITSSVTK